MRTGPRAVGPVAAPGPPGRLPVHQVLMAAPASDVLMVGSSWPADSLSGGVWCDAGDADRPAFADQVGVDEPLTVGLNQAEGRGVELWPPTGIAQVGVRKAGRVCRPGWAMWFPHCADIYRQVRWRRPERPAGIDDVGVGRCLPSGWTMPCDVA